MWFVFVLFYDLLALGIALLAFFGSPVDLARIAGLLILGGASIFGTAGATLVRIFGSTTLGILALEAAALLWSVLVLTAAGWRPHAIRTASK